jgi:uncharacterized membrane protein YfcA
MAGGGIIAFLLVCVAATSFMSGVLSLGGGTLLMGIFAWLMPVSVAMMLHGVTQFTSNFARWWLYRPHTQWKLLNGYFIGAGLCLVVFTWIAFVPGKIALFLVLGLLPFVNFLVPREYALSVTRRGGALACGIVNTACLLTAGVSGPILDVFYINSGLTRQQIIATKGFTQTTGHLLKIFYFGTFLGLAGDVTGHLPLWVFAAAVPLAFLGVWGARIIVNVISDDQFRVLSQAATMGIGLLFLGRAVVLITAP